MAIVRVWVEDHCIACATSEIICPEVFKVDREEDQSTVIENVDFSLYIEKIKEAAESCPVDAIKYEES